MHDPIRQTDCPAIPTAVVRERVPADQRSRFVPAACGEVWSFFRSAGLPKPGRNVALYLEENRVEAGVEVTAAFAGNDRIVGSQLPAGRVATATHFGPYAGLGEVHAAIRRWCADHGHALSGVCWEVYGHWDASWDDDPSQIRTDVFHLLA
jgi:effector-binding domain-containing protein